jgi:hypothetical protein
MQINYRFNQASKSHCAVSPPRKTASRVGAVISGIAACMFAGGCASAAIYNPDSLATAQIGKIATICRTVMGLNPNEPPVAGLHPGTPHLDPGVSHYQGCIASLSDSLESVLDSRAAKQADADCRNKGLQSGSSELTVCILQTAVTNPNGTAAEAKKSAPLLSEEATKLIQVGSFSYASARETLRRERLACAQLGLEPGGGFARCVKNLETTFFAIDNPLD